MVMEQIAHSPVVKRAVHRHGGARKGARRTMANRLAIFGADIVSFGREGRVAIRRWFRYRKTVRELSRLTDRALADIGLDRGEIEITAYCIAERSASARPPHARPSRRGRAR